MPSHHANESGSKRSKPRSKSAMRKLLIFAPSGEKFRMQQPQGLPEFWVYEIVDKGVCVYVGMTTNPVLRMYGHRHAGTAPKSAIMRLVRRCEDWVEASREEIALIQKRQPSVNTHYNGRMPNDEAYEVWKNVEQSAELRLARMPGWNRGTADYAFTRRLIEDGLKAA